MQVNRDFCIRKTVDSFICKKKDLIVITAIKNNFVHFVKRVKKRCRLFTYTFSKLS